MRNVDGLTKLAAAVLLAALWSSEARADPANTTARALVAAWKDADRGMAAVAEVIASAFASGMSWAVAIEGRPLYCPPPTAPLTGPQPMGILERFVADHPDSADKTYGFALAASLTQAFPCAPGSTSR
jgi:hypothetical protein